MEESVGMVTAMNEVLQDASRTGNALKSISAGVSGLTVSAKDGTLKLTKAGKALEEIAGIEVWDKQTGDMKDMYEVMDELSIKWSDLSEAERTAVGTSIAGKTQLNAFNALLSNWDTAKQYVQDYKDGLTVGSAEKENEQYLDSILGKWNVLKENLKSIGNSLISSEFVKGALDGLNQLTGMIAKIATSDFGAFGLSMTGITAGIALAVKGFQALKTMVTGFRGINTLLNIGDTARDATAIANSVANVGTAVNGTSKSMKLFGNVGTVALRAVEAGFLALPIAIMAYSKQEYQARQKRIQSSKESIQSLKSELTAYQQTSDSVRSIVEEYDKLDGKTSRTSKEQERYLELTRQIAQAFPDLVSEYDSAGNPILELNGSLETYMNNLDKAYEKQARLLNNEEDKLANELENQEVRGGYLNDLFSSDREKKAYLTSKNAPKLEDGNYEKYIAQLKKQQQEEDKWYDERLKAVQAYEDAKNDVREKYRNRLQSRTDYKNTSDENKQEMESLLDLFDVYGMGEDKANKLVKSLATLDDEVVRSTEDLGEQTKVVQEVQKAYENGSKNLSQYTDGLIGAYEASGKMDVESFSKLVNEIKSYVDETGDLEGANAQISKLSDYLGKISGLDSNIWEKALQLNYEPLEIAQEKLSNFLQTYGTGSQHLGKGGLADKLEKEFETLRELPMELAQEAMSNGGVLSAEFILDATVDAPTSIQEAVKGFLADNGQIDPQEIPVLLQIIEEIQNEGEISSETEQLLKDVLPDEVEDEIISNIKVETDVQGEQEVDDYLKKFDTLDKTVETEIRAIVNNGSEVEELYQSIEKLPKEKQLHAVANFGKIKDEAYQLGVSLEGIPTETLVRIASEMDTSQVEMFVQMIGQVDNKQVTAFLQTDGALEALEQCKSVQEMLDLINGKKTIADIESNVEGQEKVDKLNTTLEETEGAHNVELLIATNEGNFPQYVGEIKEIDGKTYIATINTVTNTLEWVALKQDMESVDDKTIKVEGQGVDNGVSELKEKVETLPDKKSIAVEVVQSGTNLVNSISEWISSVAKKNKQSVTIEAKVGKVDTSALTNITAKPIEIKANTSNAISQVNSLKTAVNSIQTKTVNITTNVVGLNQINTLKSSINSLQSKSISVSVSAVGVNNITTLKNAISGLQGKTITVNVIAEGATGIAKLISSIAGVNAKQVTVVARVVGTSQVTTLISAINKVKSKNVKITATTSGTGAVQSLASAIANVRSKTVKVNVNRSVTTTTQTVGASASASSYSPTPMSLLTSDIVSASNGVSPIDVPVTATAKSGISNLNNILPSIDFDVNMFKSLEEALENLSAQLGVIDKKMEGTFGQEKVNLLKQQIPLLKEQQKVQEQIIQDERKVNAELTKWLKNKGFTFDNLGNITNYNDKLLDMEKNVDSLKKKYDNLNNAENKNEKAVKSAQKAYDDANDVLSKAKDYLNEYFETNSTSILEATEKWYDYQNQIEDVQQSIRDLQRELKELDIDSGYKNVERDISEIQNKLDMNEVLLDMAKGDEATRLLEERIKLTQQLQKETQDLINYENQLRNGLMTELSQYGFNFREDGSIIEYSQKIEKLKQSLSDDEFEYVFEKIEEYIEKTNETIPELQIEYEKFNKEIADSKENMQDVKDEATELVRELRKLNEDSAYKDNERDLKELEGLLKINEAKLKKANGQERIDLLEEQIELTKKLQKETRDMLNFENSRRNSLMSELGGYGFSFRSDGSMANYGNIIARLKQTLSEDEFDEVFAKVENYLKTTYETIPNLEAEWYKLGDAITDSIEEIEELQRQMKLLYNETKLQSLNYQFERLETQLGIINNELEFAYGTDKLNLMTKAIDLMNQQLELQSDIIKNANDKMKVYQSDLMDYGFEFDEIGNITNLTSQMDWFRDTDSWEEINKLVQDYFDAQGEIQKVTKDYSDLEKAIKDAHQEQLNITKEIEEEITKVIEKEQEKREKEVKEYTDARIKLLKEEQDAYRKMREEQNYEESMEDQLKEVETLRKQIEIAKRDTSLSGEKRLAELTKELAEAEKELANITQEKIDKDYEGNIDSEIEKLENEQDRILKTIEEQFSEENVAKMVAKALSTGFIEINGEMRNLQEVLLESINNSAEGYSVMSDVIKNELVANLNVALETMQQMENISKSLGLENYNVLGEDSIAVMSIPSYEGGKTITIGDTHLTINGSVSEEIISDIEELINQKNNEMLNKITSNL